MIDFPLVRNPLSGGVLIRRIGPSWMTSNRHVIGSPAAVPGATAAEPTTGLPAVVLVQPLATSASDNAQGSTRFFATLEP